MKKTHYKTGQTSIVIALVMLIITTSFLLSITAPAIVNLGKTYNLKSSLQSYTLARSVAEDYIYRLFNAMDLPSETTLTIAGMTATASSTDISGGKYVTSVGSNSGFSRYLKYQVILGDSVSFNYGVQCGAGGLRMYNSSTIIGNLYCNGSIIGASNNITGSAVSTGATGLINNIRTGTNAYAHSITNSRVGGNAYYYSNISGTTVIGSSFPNSEDQQPLPFSIPDQEIEDWKATAAAGGIISSPCPYIVNGNTTLGPAKINCDFEVRGGTLTLTGPLWINGNFEASNFTDIAVSSNYSNQSIAIIVDSANRLTGSKIDFGQNGNFAGSGTKSYVLAVSMNNSAELGGSESAVSVANSIQGDLLVFAPHGLVSVANSVSLKEISAYKISTRNNSVITYETGLQNVLFTSGPEGGFSINWYRETR